jgi:urocanate hydratase
MFDNFMKEGLNLWSIGFHNITDSRVDTHYVNVSAQTVEEAIEKIHATYPSAKIQNVNHKGRIHI